MQPPTRILSSGSAREESPSWTKLSQNARTRLDSDQNPVFEDAPRDGGHPQELAVGFNGPWWIRGHGEFAPRESPYRRVREMHPQLDTGKERDRLRFSGMNDLNIQHAVHHGRLRSDLQSTPKVLTVRKNGSQCWALVSSLPRLHHNL